MPLRRRRGLLRGHVHRDRLHRVERLRELADLVPARTSIGVMVVHEIGLVAHAGVAQLVDEGRQLLLGETVDRVRELAQRCRHHAGEDESKQDRGQHSAGSDQQEGLQVLRRHVAQGGRMDGQMGHVVVEDLVLDVEAGLHRVLPQRRAGGRRLCRIGRQRRHRIVDRGASRSILSDTEIAWPDMRSAGPSPRLRGGETVLDAEPAVAFGDRAAEGAFLRVLERTAAQADFEHRRFFGGRVLGVRQRHQRECLPGEARVMRFVHDDTHEIGDGFTDLRVGGRHGVDVATEIDRAAVRGGAPR